jgi:hypothetical protein
VESTTVPLFTEHTWRRLGAVCILSLTALSCQAIPPPASFQGPTATVRAEAEGPAAAVSELLEELAPDILETLPDTVKREFEVWVQPTPVLHRFDDSAYEGADGFWSEGHGRIHLREGAESLQRTLAHELVHASLGESWSALPGTIEEGLCDVVAAQLVPEGACELRAGRLSAAAFATGGLELEVEVLLPAEINPRGVRVGCISRIRLLGISPSTLIPADVFEVEAGLSSNELPTNDKKVFYGLSYVLVERIVAAHGFEGLHRLCVEAREAGFDEVPAAALLNAAGLRSAEPGEWRRAIHEAIGEAELRTLLLIYPSALLDAVARIFGPRTRVEVDLSGASPLRAAIGVPGGDGTARVELGLLVAANPVISRENPVQGE